MEDRKKLEKLTLHKNKSITHLPSDIGLYESGLCLMFPN